MSFPHLGDYDANRAASSVDDTPTLTSTLSSSVAGAAPPVLENLVPRAGTTVDYLNDRARHAANVAIAAAEIATDVGQAHDVLTENHRRLFLEKAFGLNLGGTSLGDDFMPKKQYRSVKSVEQYNEMVRILSLWGDDEFVKNASANCDAANDFRRYRRKNKNGYMYSKDFYVQNRELLDGSFKNVLVKKSDNSIVSDMLSLFDVIDEAHRAGGHMGIDRTLQATKPTYHSPTQELVTIYCQLCYVCKEKTPVIPVRKGAKKPIISSAFRDRFQVDLIDMRACRRKNEYGVWMRWILTVKDHSTGLIWLSSLPFKAARFVVYELERYFGFVGYPQIFHTDNGKEFVAKKVVELLKKNNPHCYPIQGRPRTPRDQGSVERGNGTVQRILNSILSERRQLGLHDNWTLILGQVMTCCNNHSTRLKYSVSAYEAVFGQKLQTPVSCSIDQLRKCRSIADRLRICPDERLQAYVDESDIISCRDDDDNEEEPDEEDSDEEDSLQDDASQGRGNDNEDDANDDDDDAKAGRGNDDEDDDFPNYAAAHVPNSGRGNAYEDDDYAARHKSDEDDGNANYTAAHFDVGDDDDPFLDAQSTQDEEEEFQHSLAEDINMNRKRSREDDVEDLHPSLQEVTTRRAKMLALIQRKVKEI